MTPPWKGAARRATPDDFSREADVLRCELPVLLAVWEVEASGQPFQSDGTLTRRYEPHHMVPKEGDWRTSLALSTSTRERKLLDAYRRDPEAAMRATSWGAPQIMGFNHAASGYPSARAMVEAFADDEAAQLAGFAAFVRSNNLVGALRARDWRTFAATYNGSGQVDVYASRLESAYRRHSGKSSPKVLRLGASGEAVSRLQEALGVEPDGQFGKVTESAVKEFQIAHGLSADGVVGAKTWEALEASRGAAPMVQPTRGDRWTGIGKKVAAGTAAVSSVAAAGKQLSESVPESSLNILLMGGMGLAAVAMVLWFIERQRDAA